MVADILVRLIAVPACVLLLEVHRHSIEPDVVNVNAGVENIHINTRSSVFKGILFLLLAVIGDQT